MAKPLDVGDVEQLSVRKTAASLQRDKELEDLRTVLATNAGKAFLWRLLGECGIYRISAHEGAIGKRALGLWLIEELSKVRPDAYIELQIEALSEKLKRGNTNG